MIGTLKGSGQVTGRPLKIYYLAAEVVPFAKTGGLADVAGTLPKVLHDLGHELCEVLPYYGLVDRAEFGLQRVIEELEVPLYF